MIRFVRNSSVLTIALIVFCAVVSAPLILAQEKQQEKKPQSPTTESKETGKLPTQKELEKDKKRQAAETKMSAAEATVELAIIAYGGRKQLETARAAIQEQGTVRLATDQGDSNGSFMLRSVRKEKSGMDLLRVDLELTPPAQAQDRAQTRTVNYVIAFNGASVWSAQNNQYVNPSPEVEAAFRAQLTHDYTTLLRYKEDGSKIELKEPETVVGVTSNVIELTQADGSKTRYWLSTKTFRVLHLEYESKNASGQTTKYRISFYYTPLKVVQNTLVPTRRVMTQDGKLVQEITLNNIVYSAKLDPEIFQHLQEQ